MHPKYTNVKYVFLYIRIYEEHDFQVSQAKLAAYAWFFYILLLCLIALSSVRIKLLVDAWCSLYISVLCVLREMHDNLSTCLKWP